MSQIRAMCHRRELQQSTRDSKLVGVESKHLCALKLEALVVKRVVGCMPLETTKDPTVREKIEDKCDSQTGDSTCQYRTS